jgi:hypothetical protein
MEYKLMNEKITPVLSKTTKLFTTSEEIDRAIASAIKGATKNARDYQKIAVSMLVQLSDGIHKGNITPLRAMIESMPKSLRADSMCRFLELYGQVSFVEKERDGKTTTVMVFDKKKKLQLGLAMEKAWWMAKVASEYKPFDFMVELGKLVDRASKKLDKGIDTDKGDNIDVNMVSLARDLYATLEAA